MVYIYTCVCVCVVSVCVCVCVCVHIYVYIGLGKNCLCISRRLVRGLSYSISSIHIDTLNEIPYFINITARKKIFLRILCSFCISCPAPRAKSHISCTWYQAISAFVYPNLSNIIPLHAERRWQLISMRISKTCCQIEKNQQYIYLIATFLKSFNFLWSELCHGDRLHTVSKLPTVWHKEHQLINEKKNWNLLACQIQHQSTKAK